MATSRPFAYNTGASISGTTQTGDLAVGVSDEPYADNYGGVIWWNGPDEELGYVIAVPVSSNTQPTPIPGVFASVGFWRSDDLTEGSFVDLTNTVFNQTFSSATEASIWLTANGYWNSYPVIPISTPTPTPTTTSVTPTPSVTPTQTLTPTTTSTPTPTPTEPYFLLFEDDSIATAENDDNIEIEH